MSECTLIDPKERLLVFGDQVAKEIQEFVPFWVATGKTAKHRIKLLHGPVDCMEMGGEACKLMNSGHVITVMLLVYLRMQFPSQPNPNCVLNQFLAQRGSVGGFGPWLNKQAQGGNPHVCIEMNQLVLPKVRAVAYFESRWSKTHWKTSRSVWNNVIQSIPANEQKGVCLLRFVGFNVQPQWMDHHPSPRWQDQKVVDSLIQSTLLPSGVLNRFELCRIQIPVHISMFESLEKTRPFVVLV